MKKKTKWQYFLGVSATLLLGGLSFKVEASSRYGMAGCGLGSLLWRPTGGQISAATTNSSSYSQFFGISSGTSNCLPSKKMAMIRRQQEFLAANLSTLQKELARGEGESLHAFADVLGCRQEIHSDAVNQLVQGYGQIFRGAGINGVLERAKKELSKQETTAQGCDAVS